MSGSQVVSDYVIQFGKVGSSSVDDAEGAVLFNVAGIAQFDATGDEPTIGLGDDVGETDESSEVYGVLGVVARPLPPDESSGTSKHAEVVCLRTSDGLVPVSARDLRLRMGGNAPNEGVVALIGYGGGFHSLTPVNDGDDGTIHTVYCPYDFSGGVAQKAHSITLDPTSGNESITVVHADGQSILLQNDGSIQLQSPDGQAYLKLENKKLFVQADQIVLNGSVCIGDANLSLPFPLAPGPSSPPCPRLFLAPTP